MRRPTRRRFAAAAAAFSAAAALPRVALAADVTASIAVERERARVGEGVVLALEVSSESGRAPQPTLPKGLADAFEVGTPSVGTSSQVSFGMGRATRAETHTMQVIVVPRKTGKFELGFEVRHEGRKIRSNIAVLEVVSAADPTTVDPSSGKPLEARGDVFPWASTDKVRAYVGEQITYRFDLYQRRTFLNVRLRTTPSFKDFLAVELDEGEATDEVIGGVGYRRQPALRRALFPQRAGTLTIGAAEIQIGFRARVRRGPVIDVEVQPLPAEGQPEGFSPNNVGNFEVATKVDRTELSPGDPFTLTITIKGDGNISVIDPGAWPEIDGARVYDPKLETRQRTGSVVGGERSYAFLIIPEAPGKLIVPAYEFDFFDPGQEAYKRVRSEPIEVTVAGEAIPGAQDVGDEAPQPAHGEQLEAVLVFDSVPRDRPRQLWLTQTRWIYGMAAPPALAVAGLGAGALWRRFGPDEDARARARGRMRRQLRIKAATEAVQSGEGFHAAVARLLQELALGRAGADGVGLPRPALVQLLARDGVAEGDLRKLEALLERCDSARFGAGSGGADERQRLLEEALDLVRRSSLAKGAA